MQCDIDIEAKGMDVFPNTSSNISSNGSSEIPTVEASRLTITFSDLFSREKRSVRFYS